MKKLSLLIILMLCMPGVYSQNTSGITVHDTRRVNDLPSFTSQTIRADFKLKDIINAPGLSYYSTNLTISPWKDNSGGLVHQLNFNDGGIYYRTGVYNGSWNGWRKFVIEDANGNVGIGTATPTTTLDVVGNKGSVNEQNFRVTYVNGGNLLNTEFSALAQNFEKVGGNGWTALYAKQGSASKAGVFEGDVSIHGNVGIGTTTPQSHLHVTGNTYTSNMSIGRSGSHYDEIGFNLGFTKKGDQYTYRENDFAASIRLGYSGSIEFRTAKLGAKDSPLALVERMKITESGNVGIGTATPTATFDVAGHNGGTNQRNFRVKYYIEDDAYLLNTEFSALTHIPEKAGGNGWTALYARQGKASKAGVFEGDVSILGSVGIGTTNPDQLLTVKGKIHAEEVLVDLNVPLADYVFKPGYPLMELSELEQFVKTNSHLPNIPTASQVVENGLSLGEMQNKLLQKVEELTLYVIEQNKKIEAQEKRIKELEAKNNANQP